MEIIKLLKSEDDRLNKIENDLKFIIECLSKIQDIKENMSVLLEQKKEREQEQENLLWLQQSIVVEFITEINGELTFTNLEETREYFYKKIDEFIKIMNYNMVAIGKLSVKKNGNIIMVCVKDLQILKSIIAMGYGNIEFKDYSCKCLNIDFTLDFKYDKVVQKYLDNLFKGANL